MKILNAWDSLEKENLMLKLLILPLFVALILLSLAISVKIREPPLVIERGCYSKPVLAAPSLVTTEELKAFLDLALRARFDSTNVDLSYLSGEQKSYRESEQKELANQKMRQTLIVNEIEIKNGSAFIDTDRVISVGNIRSTFPFQVRAEYELTPRSESNPYGLLLTNVEPLHQEVKK